MCRRDLKHAPGFEPKGDNAADQPEVNGNTRLVERNIDENAVASGAPRQRFFEAECLRDEGAFRNPPFPLRVDEPGDGAETNVRMLATVSRESPNESAASARVSGWSGTSAVENGFGTSRLYHKCISGVAVKGRQTNHLTRTPALLHVGRILLADVPSDGCSFNGTDLWETDRMPLQEWPHTVAVQRASGRKELEMESLDRARREFAEKIRATAALRSEVLVRAFASVPREDFVGPGPWKVFRPPEVRMYEVTRDADPRHLYEDVLVALDASRSLNNGQPSGLARWLDNLDLAPGDRVLHIGGGVGYYSAIAAEAVTPDGCVVGAEVDPELAERARRNLIPWPNATVVCADGCEFEAEPFDVIFVNAGATEVVPRWLDQLRDGASSFRSRSVSRCRMWA